MAISGANMQFWVFAFIPTVFGMSMYWAIAITLTIAHGLVWFADHRNDPLEFAFHWHVTLMVVLWVGACLGVSFVSSLRSPKLIDGKVLDQTTGRVTSLGIWNIILLLSVCLTVFGTFLLMGKYVPLLDQSSFGTPVGIAALVIGIVLILTSLSIMWFILHCNDPWARMNVKYYMHVFMFLGVFGIYDLKGESIGLVEQPHQGWLTLITIVVVYIIALLTAVFVKTSHLDPFYRMWRSALKFYGTLFVIEFLLVLVGWIADNFISTNDTLTVFWAVLIYSTVLLMFILILGVSKALRFTCKKQPRTVDLYQCPKITTRGIVKRC